MADFGKVMAAIASGLCVSCVAGVAAEIPDAALRVRGANAPRIVEIREAQNVRFAIINAGLNSKLRAGVQCAAGEAEKGGLIVVDASLEKCVALILDGAQPKSGDRVYIIPAN